MHAQHPNNPSVYRNNLYFAKLDRSDQLMSAVLEDGDVRAGTSRFLSQTAFCFYKGTLMLYFVFWSVFIPVAKQGRFGMIFYTFWTFYAATGCEWF